ncbi:MAG TPA: 3'-5' exonuclease, partial [Verrucomicrobiae bacterium]|nr:3'-5' exonuclease [Verrucomicrobiae bacterium]
LERLLEAWDKESGNAELPVQEALEYLYEACAESRRDFSYGEGVTLSTVHSAKGTEYDHVLLIGPWRAPGARAREEEERRTFYVGLTRARKTLAVIDRVDTRPSFPQQMDGRGIVRYGVQAEEGNSPVAWQDYRVLSLEDIHLGYPGQFAPNHRIHRALAELNPGDKLTMRSLPGNGLGLFAGGNTCVARLSRSAQTDWADKVGCVSDARVLAMLRRRAEQDTDEARRGSYLVPEWEVPVVEVVATIPNRT